jgi:hypothetical protein
MNNLYHKVLVVSVFTALGFAMGVNKEAKAATFTLTIDGFRNNGTSFLVADVNRDGLGDWYYGGVPLPVGRRLRNEEYRALYEFNLASLSLASNTVISSAILLASVNSIEERDGGYAYLQAYGYIGNGQADVSDFEAGEYLDRKNFGFIMHREPVGVIDFNVLPFINQRIRNNDAFAGFSIHNDQIDHYGDDDLYIHLNQNARLIITTVDVPEPVPEPTTIFGSALALSVGGWLKRKKFNQQSKTTSQH